MLLKRSMSIACVNNVVAVVAVAGPVALAGQEAPVVVSVLQVVVARRFVPCVSA